MKHGRLINKVFPRVYDAEELAEITGPVLLIFGEQEMIYGDLQSAIEFAKRLIRKASVAVIPNAHHIAALAQPEQANQELLRFFAS